MDTISILTIPIAGYLIIDHIMLEKYKKFARRFWQIHLIYLIVTMIVIQFPGKLFLYTLINIFISCILMIVCAGLIFRCRKQVGNEIKILETFVSNLISML